MKTMMLAILILVLSLAAVAGEADDRMFQMLTAPRTPGAREASDRIWSEMAATLRREGARLTVQADKSVTLTQNYADGRLFWMRSTTTGSRETCTARAWLSGDASSIFVGVIVGGLHIRKLAPLAQRL